MVYVTRDGRVLSHQPWGISRVYSMFVGFIMAIMFFFQSLIDPIRSNFGTGSSPNQRDFFGFGRGSGGGGGGSGGGGGGSGGGGGGSDGRGPPKPPRRPMGRITHQSDVTVPGGCAGGSCGR